MNCRPHRFTSIGLPRWRKIALTCFVPGISLIKFNNCHFRLCDHTLNKMSSARNEWRTLYEMTKRHGAKQSTANDKQNRVNERRRKKHPKQAKTLKSNVNSIKRFAERRQHFFPTSFFFAWKLMSIFSSLTKMSIGPTENEWHEMLAKTCSHSL